MFTPPLFCDLVHTYDVFLFDVYGVVHDGQNPIESTLHVMKNLHDHQKIIILVSNSPLQNDALKEHLLKMNVPLYYQNIYTAGHLTHMALKDHQDPLHTRLGTYCYFIGEPDDAVILMDTPYSRVDALDEANFILMTSVESGMTDLTDYDDVLKEALHFKLPFICANPDLYQCHHDQIALRPGSFANRYQAMGGKVIFHGKPHRTIYQKIVSHHALTPSRILVVGDCLTTDIQGAQTMGFDSVLLAGPVVYRELECPLNESVDKVVHQLKNFRYTPTYVTPYLKWD